MLRTIPKVSLKNLVSRSNLRDALPKMKQMKEEQASDPKRSEACFHLIT
jgi:hypothetical protein